MVSIRSPVRARNRYPDESHWNPMFFECNPHWEFITKRYRHSNASPSDVPIRALAFGIVNLAPKQPKTLYSRQVDTDFMKLSNVYKCMYILKTRQI